MPRAIVIGSSSGIGWSLARVLAREGYDVGLAGRRVEQMEELRREIGGRAVVRRLDLTVPTEARQGLRELLEEMGDVDLIVVNSGVGYSDPDWEQEKEILAVNVVGFAAMANLALEYFIGRGVGQLVGISSISALRGLAAAYSGSKAFASIYLEGLRLKVDRLGVDVQVLDVKPGFVATPMTAGRTDMFWVASADRAARQIYQAIRKRRRHVYVTRRWRLIAWMMKSLPYSLVARLSGKRRS
ncbi:MAG: SDR family NAD(P)-dependent oxidoreductase [Gemmatimonadota bacterium]|nr:MAG: SDR family NAD(P)-dependent oxidoreductase [Gemmatimonadota bacterium]